MNMDQRIFASFIIRNIELKFDKVERKLIAHFLRLPFHNYSQVYDFFYRLLILFLVVSKILEFMRVVYKQTIFTKVISMLYVIINTNIL